MRLCAYNLFIMLLTSQPRCNVQKIRWIVTSILPMKRKSSMPFISRHMSGLQGSPVVSIQVKSIRYTCKVDSIQTHVTSSRFDTEYYTISKWPNESSKTYSLERTQTSVVNKTNPYLHEPTRTSSCTQASYAIRTHKRDQVLVNFINLSRTEIYTNTL